MFHFAELFIVVVVVVVVVFVVAVFVNIINTNCLYCLIDCLTSCRRCVYLDGDG